MAALLMLSLEPGPRERSAWVLWEGCGYGGSCGSCRYLQGHFGAEGDQPSRGRGSGMAAVSLLQLLLMGKGRPGARSQGRVVAADMLLFCRRRMLSHSCSACSSF